MVGTDIMAMVDTRAVITMAGTAGGVTGIIPVDIGGGLGAMLILVGGGLILVGGGPIQHMLGYILIIPIPGPILIPITCLRRGAP